METAKKLNAIKDHLARFISDNQILLNNYIEKINKINASLDNADVKLLNDCIPSKDEIEKVKRAELLLGLIVFYQEILHYELVGEYNKHYKLLKYKNLKKLDFKKLQSESYTVPYTKFRSDIANAMMYLLPTKKWILHKINYTEYYNTFTYWQVLLLDVVKVLLHNSIAFINYALQYFNLIFPHNILLNPFIRQVICFLSFILIERQLPEVFFKKFTSIESAYDKHLNSKSNSTTLQTEYWNLLKNKKLKYIKSSYAKVDTIQGRDINSINDIDELTKMLYAELMSIDVNTINQQVTLELEQYQTQYEKLWANLSKEQQASYIKQNFSPQNILIQAASHNKFTIDSYNLRIDLIYFCFDIAIKALFVYYVMPYIMLNLKIFLAANSLLNPLGETFITIVNVFIPALTIQGVYEGLYTFVNALLEYNKSISDKSVVK
jgi:hypothetical protein